MPEDYDIQADSRTSVWEALHHLIRILEGDGGVAGAGEFLHTALTVTTT